jgi:hypothetical protein
MFVALARKTRFAMRSINNHQGNTSASSNGTSLLEPKQVTAALREQTPDAKPPERVPVRTRLPIWNKGIGIETARHPRKRSSKQFQPNEREKTCLTITKSPRLI